MLENAISGTSDNGDSEEWTTSLQWTNCSPPAYIYIYYPYISTSEEGTTFEQWTKHSSLTFPLFEGSIELVHLNFILTMKVSNIWHPMQNAVTIWQRSAGHWWTPLPCSYMVLFVRYSSVLAAAFAFCLGLVQIGPLAYWVSSGMVHTSYSLAMLTHNETRNQHQVNNNTINVFLASSDTLLMYF